MKMIALEDLRPHFDEVEQWIKAGEEVTLIRDDVAVAVLRPLEQNGSAPRPPVKALTEADWERWFCEHPPVKPEPPLTAEETEAFHQALKRDL